VSFLRVQNHFFEVARPIHDHRLLIPAYPSGSLDQPIEIYIIVLLIGRAIAGNRNARLLFVPTILLYGTGVLGGLLLFSFQLGWRSHTFGFH
jgi:hypothetical protein